MVKNVVSSERLDPRLMRGAPEKVNLRGSCSVGSGWPGNAHKIIQLILIVNSIDREIYR